MAVCAYSAGIDLIALADLAVNGGELAFPAADRCQVDL
jgi:hypothetical protein